MKRTLALLVLAAAPSFAGNLDGFVTGFANGLRHAQEQRRGYQTQDQYSTPSYEPKTWDMVNTYGNTVVTYLTLDMCRMAQQNYPGETECVLHRD